MVDLQDLAQQLLGQGAELDLAAGTIAGAKNRQQPRLSTSRIGAGLSDKRCVGSRRFSLVDGSFELVGEGDAQSRTIAGYRWPIRL